MEIDSLEICDTLWPINATNLKLEWKTIKDQKYVLVGSFNRHPESYSDTSLINSWGEIWVFLPRQLKYRMKPALLEESDTLMRLNQLLGLPPENTNNYIVELWVKPGDLFRPAADMEIDDSKAGPYFPANTDKVYMNWFNQNIYNSYFSSWTHYPWTRLGYTYDWAESAPEVGISEYCIKTNSLIFVQKLYPALKYLENEKTD
jgi:hypothetical protein